MISEGKTILSQTTLSWSSGKDSAWALHTLNQQQPGSVCALLTTFNDETDRVAMHAVRRSLVRQQAAALSLPLIEVALPWPCSNAIYEEQFAAAAAAAATRFGATNIAFGDLFLEDIRNYRERQCEELGLQPLFPLWGMPTAELADTMIDGGLAATITCVDPRQLDPRFVGRTYDHQLLDDLPAHVDPCGENGEFHTLTWNSPDFSAPLGVQVTETVERDGFAFADIIATMTGSKA